MFTHSFKRVSPLASIVLALLAIPVLCAKPCATMTIKVEPTSVSPGSQAMASGSIKNCSTVEEDMLLKYTATGPCDFSFSGTVKMDVAAGQTRSTSMPFIVPATACVGTYKLTVAAVLNKVQIATTSASLTVK
ncbi:MAG TPA: hypothetical protein VLZ81_11505 [Blastocatellia bacterium]|nr:hypothetical protein [Blastocatellia bacterium]